MMKEALLGRQIGGGKVECYACSRRCRIPEGSHGFCYVRQNVGGKLHLVNYGVMSAMQIDPIEKKPFNHFMPGTYVFGVGSSSCNWGCLFCQNHNISKDREIEGEYISPREMVQKAVDNYTSGIVFTYNEPTIFIEYALDVAKEAHRKGLFTMFVTNGYMTQEAVKEMKGRIDAAVVNFKGNGEQKFTNKFEAVQSNEPIKESMLAMKDAGIHLEITDLVIPMVGDSIDACDSLTRWVSDSLGTDTPIHFTRFHPDYKMLDYPNTDYATLKRHYDVARKNGLEYAYIGNVSGNPYANTYCPECAEPAIERSDLYLSAWNLDDKNRCMRCGHTIPIRGSAPKRIRRRRIETVY
jgi:pyruvate formate lyase activating enzyme